MTEFYVAASKRIVLPSGRPFQLWRGIHHIPNELSDHPSANGCGIKPVDEMTEDEWAALALDKDAWMAKNRPATQPSLAGSVTPDPPAQAGIAPSAAASPSQGTLKPA